MKINVKNLEMAMARACMSATKTAEAAGICRQTLLTARNGYHVSPWTIGMIAKALNVDITEIIEKDDE